MFIVAAPVTVKVAKVAAPAVVIDQSSPPVRAKVVEAWLLPMAMTSAAVELVAMLMVEVAEEVTPPMSMVWVVAVSPKSILPAPSKDISVLVSLSLTILKTLALTLIE